MDKFKINWVTTGSCLCCFYKIVLCTAKEKRNYYKKRSSRIACKGCPRQYFSDQEYNNEKQCYKQHLKNKK